mgnify:CR=1 FL=1
MRDSATLGIKMTLTWKSCTSNVTTNARKIGRVSFYSTTVVERQAISLLSPRHLLSHSFNLEYPSAASYDIERMIDCFKPERITAQTRVSQDLCSFQILPTKDRLMIWYDTQKVTYRVKTCEGSEVTKEGTNSTLDESKSIQIQVSLLRKCIKYRKFLPRTDAHEVNPTKSALLNKKYSFC